MKKKVYCFGSLLIMIYIAILIALLYIARLSQGNRKDTMYTFALVWGCLMAAFIPVTVTATRNLALPDIEATVKVISHDIQESRVLIRGGVHRTTFYYPTFELEDRQNLRFPVRYDDFISVVDHNVGSLTYKKRNQRYCFVKFKNQTI